MPKIADDIGYEKECEMIKKFKELAPRFGNRTAVYEELAKTFHVPKSYVQMVISVTDQAYEVKRNNF